MVFPTTMVPRFKTGYLYPTLVSLLMYCNSAGSVCLVGLNYGSQLGWRNTTIANIMNTTLLDITKNATSSVLAVSNMDLQKTLTMSYQVTSANVLKFVSNGGLSQINWASETKGKTSNASVVVGMSLIAYIDVVFTQPIYDQLYTLANNYSFSLGIFKPYNYLFGFTGLNSTGFFLPSLTILDRSCVANRVFVWRMETDLLGVYGLSDYISPQFANFTTMIEQAFDEFYRLRVSLFANDFVRVVVTDVYDGNTFPAYFRMEVYFLNGSYTPDYVEINTLDKLGQLPKLYFWDGSLKTTVAIESSSIYSYVTTSYSQSENIPIGTSNESTMEITSSTLTTLLRTSTNPVTNLTTNSSTSKSSTTSLPTTSISLTTPSLNTSTPVPVTFSSSLAPTLSQTNGTTPVATLSHTNGTTLLANSQLQTTSVSGQSSSNTSVNGVTTLVNSSTATNSSNVATTQLLKNTNGTSTTNNAILANQTSKTIQVSEITASTAFGNANSNSPSTTANVSSLSTITSTNVTQQSFTTQFGNNPQGQTTITATSNNRTTTSTARNATTLQYNTGSTTSNNSTSLNKINSSNTHLIITFDPDPFFQPNEKVPVVTKRYNDGYLLKKQMGTMSSLLQQTSFFTLTIPAAIGMIIFVFCCLFLWQIDCLGKFSPRNKN